MQYFQYVINLGPIIVIPLILTLAGVIMGIRLTNALRASLTVGIGFIGLGLVIDYLVKSLGPAVLAMVSRFGLRTDILDVGWQALAATAFASNIGILVIPTVLLVNIVMLFTKTTQTINIDVWNFWHFAFTGAVVSTATGSIPFGLLAAGLQSAIVLVIADRTAEGVEKYCGLSGVSLPQAFSASLVPIAYLVNKMLDKIPMINKTDIDVAKINKRLDILSEPIFIGTIWGAIIGALAGYGLKEICTLALSMGAALVLIPKMAGLLAEGLIPVSGALGEFIKKRAKGYRKVYIGLDSSVGIGHPVAMAASMIFIPITIIIAVVLPGNKFLPFTDLAALPFVFVLIVTVTGGNLFRTLIIGLFVVTLGLWISTDMAPVITKTALGAKVANPYGDSMISALSDGINPLTWLFFRIFEFKLIGGTLMCAVVSVLALLNRKRIIRKMSEGDKSDI